MKKIIALLLALSMMAVAVSCGKKNEENNAEGKNAEVSTENNDGKAEEKFDDKQAENSEENKDGQSADGTEKQEEKKPEVNYNTEEDKAAAKAAVDGFMKAFSSYDINEMSKYVNVDLAEKLGFTDFHAYIDSKVKSSFSEEESLTVYADDILEIVNTTYAKILESTSYEIADAEYSGGKWTFDVNASLVTLYDITSALQGEKAQELVDEVIPDELLEELEEQGGEISPELIESIVNDMLAGTVRILKESCENAQPKSYSYKVTAVKSADKWIVDYSVNDASTIVGLIG